MVAVPSKGRADAGFHRIAPEAALTRELYERHAAKIFAFCLGRLRDREEAEDATQSTFLNAFRGLQRGIAPDHEQAWLYKIAENVCLTRQRSRVRRRRVEAPGDLDALQDVIPSPSHDSDELLQLPQALQGMPEQQRRALLLREWQGLSYREIGEELDLSQAAVETLLFRARRTLANGLIDETPKKKGLAARVRAVGDTGSIVALLKTLFFSGGTKVVVAGAIAAGSVVAASPSVRHAVEDAVVPPSHKVAPAPHTTAPVRYAPAVASQAPAAVPHAVPARHTVTKPAPPAFARGHRLGNASSIHPVAPVERTHPAHPVTPASQPAHTERPVAAVSHGRSAEHHTATTPAKHEHPAQPAAKPEPARGRSADARGRTHAAPQSDQTQSQAQPQQQPQQQPSTQPATPVDQATDTLGAVQQQATDTAQGLANGLGHVKK